MLNALSLREDAWCSYYRFITVHSPLNWIRNWNVWTKMWQLYISSSQPKAQGTSQKWQKQCKSQRMVSAGKWCLLNRTQVLHAQTQQWCLSAWDPHAIKTAQSSSRDGEVAPEALPLTAGILEVGTCYLRESHFCVCVGASSVGCPWPSRWLHIYEHMGSADWLQCVVIII